MTNRIFLGWDRPFLTLAAEWLLGHGDALPRALVVVPTSQSGRRLREALAEQAGGALLSPKIMTPGALLATPDPVVAAEWAERVAWMEVMDHVSDWREYEELFPEPPDSNPGWSTGFAADLTSLRRTLQENGLTISSASRILSRSIESGRWEALARLENKMERMLARWSLQSRSRMLAEGVRLPADTGTVVLAGITGMPPLLEKAFHAWGGAVSVLIAAPESEADGFSELGKPLACWTARPLPWAEGDKGRVHLVADPRQEAAEALRVVAEHKQASDNIALACADRETGDELARVFTRAGWVSFHPAAQTVASGLQRWFKAWSAWLADPTLANMAVLLAMPETSGLVEGGRGLKAELLATLRNDWMAMRVGDLRQRIDKAVFHSETQRANAFEVMRLADALEKRRERFLNGNLSDAMAELLERMPEEQTRGFREWLANAAPVMGHVKRDAVFWLALMLEDLPAPAPPPPDGRVLDVQGWLELLFEPGGHLVLCGMNEGKVPARNPANSFLGASACQLLGLVCDADLAARDAFLYQAMLQARSDGGRVDVFCAKSGSGGESLLPSRLLLATDRENLPGRVSFLFREVEPPEAGMRWHADWKWKPRRVEIPESLSVTSFAAWLACPFRFYLKHALRMQESEPGRIEWNARDFGSVAHQILERWGKDATASCLTDEAALHGWLSDMLDTVVHEWFGANAPLAIRLQTESMRQRLRWFARKQAVIRESGWETIEVETKFELRIGPSRVRGTYDRLDRHREFGDLRVIDYKTGKAGAVEKAHRSKIVAATTLPAHVPEDSPVMHETADGKAHRWTNLQLPLYAISLQETHGAVPRPCYFHLGPTEADVSLEEWENFSDADLAAAERCTEWVVSQIHAGVFWPPAEKPGHDDFETLAAGRTLGEMCEPAHQP